MGEEFIKGAWVKQVHHQKAHSGMGDEPGKGHPTVACPAPRLSPDRDLGILSFSELSASSSLFSHG